MPMAKCPKRHEASKLKTLVCSYNEADIAYDSDDTSITLLDSEEFTHEEQMEWAEWRTNVIRKRRSEKN